MTGSRDQTTWVICEKCSGIMSAHDVNTIAEHFASCTGDIQTSSCGQFAVAKSVLLELQHGMQTMEMSLTCTPAHTKNKARRKRNDTEEYVPVVVKQEKVEAEPVGDVNCIRRSKRTPKPKYKYDMVENRVVNTIETITANRGNNHIQKAQTVTEGNPVRNYIEDPAVNVTNEMNSTAAIVAEGTADSAQNLTLNEHEEGTALITTVPDIAVCSMNNSTEVMECEAVEDHTRATLEAIIEAKTEPFFTTKLEHIDTGKGNYAERKQQLFKEFAQYKEEVTEEGMTEDVYRCPKCKTRTFRANYIGMFGRHVRTCKPSGSEDLKCPQPDCMFVAKDAKRFSEHKRYHLQPYMCEFCPQRFADKRNMIEHRMKHTDERPYACDTCEYRTRNKRLLREHTRKHTGDFLHCPESGCGFFTPYRGSLTSHIELRHRELGKYECGHCSYVTNSRPNLKRHQATTHSDTVGAELAKLFQCSLCSYVAATKFAVISHLRSHTKEKIYFCNKCDYAASYASAFRQHMMTHLGLKTWQCGPCGYNSNTRAKVHRHLHTKHPDVDIAKAVVNLGLSLKLDLTKFRRPGERKYQLEEVTVEEMEGSQEHQVTEQAVDLGGEEVVVSEEVIGDGPHELIVMTENGEIVIPQKTFSEPGMHEVHIQLQETPQTGNIEVVPGIQ